jgi:hypothetical protein
MTSTLPQPSRTATTEIDRCLAELARGHERLAKTSATELIRLAEACVEGTAVAARDWVEAACRDKSIPHTSPLRAEDILTGPAATIRYLRLIIQSLREIAATGRPRLPGVPATGSDGRLRVPVFPARGMFDSLVFAGFKVESWMRAGVTGESLRFCPHGVPGAWNAGEPPIALVLGAGNVSSIPTTDSFGKIFHEGRTVLLKMNPVNQSLGPIFERAYAPLIDAGFLRIIYGGADVGREALAHNLVGDVHITGSIHTHDAIVWGPEGAERERRKRESDPILRKPITSELGNVTPWIVVPGKYTERQLDFQAENLATSITNNCSFNCIATKVIVTGASWPDRERFLDKIQKVLNRVAPRTAYYPGALERYERWTGKKAGSAGGVLPWTLLRSVTPQASPQFFREESFVCVCVETPLTADSDTTFLDRAVDFVNNELWGTLAASITLPPGFRGQPNHEAALQSAIARLNYGTIALNHWSGVSFAMMSPPWGGAPGRNLSDAQSGLGWVHNTFMLDPVEKNVLEGPLVVSPKPVWFAAHPNPEPIAWRLLEMNHKPTIGNLTRLLGSAVWNSR